VPTGDLGIDHVLPGPIRARPLEREIGNGAWSSERGGLGERRGEHVLVLFGVAGMPERAANREVNEHGSRGVCLLHHVAHGADDERGDAPGLQAVRYETHGLVAPWSIGRQERQLDPVRRQLGC
jgi:hypothetical protein